MFVNTGRDEMGLPEFLSTTRVNKPSELPRTTGPVFLVVFEENIQAQVRFFSGSKRVIEHILQLCVFLF